MMGVESAYKTLTGKPEGKRPLGTLRPGREDNIKMNVNGIH
jgi:hypothetical protein